MNEKINKKNIIIVICVIIVGIGVGIYINYQKEIESDSIEILENMEKEIEADNNKIKEQKNTNSNNEITKEENIAIHITGEVKKTGLLYLNKGARIADAIEKAGGASKNANLDIINLAYVLEDGQKIYIPNKKERIEQNEYINSNSGNNVIVEQGKLNHTKANGKGEQKKVNINLADQETLESLPGIGPSLAQRIIEYRENNGKFQKIEDIQNVKGIGDSKYSNIKEKICI